MLNFSIQTSKSQLSPTELPNQHSHDVDNRNAEINHTTELSQRKDRIDEFKNGKDAPDQSRRKFGVYTSTGSSINSLTFAQLFQQYLLVVSGIIGKAFVRSVQIRQGLSIPGSIVSSNIIY
jgi:hypothetical protein